MFMIVITYFAQNKVASSFKGNFYSISGQGSRLKNHYKWNIVLDSGTIWQNFGLESLGNFSPFGERVAHMTIVQLVFDFPLQKCSLYISGVISCSLQLSARLLNSSDIGRHALISSRAHCDVTELSSCHTEKQSEAEVFVEFENKMVTYCTLKLNKAQPPKFELFKSIEVYKVT